MNLEAVEEIAKAVLYEGYMLYPYRPSSVKNQQRWNFGVLCPAAYCDLQPGSESLSMQTECLLRANAFTRIVVSARFLQIVERMIGKPIGLDGREGGVAAPEMEFVDRLELGDRVYQPWQEAVERTAVFKDLDPANLSSALSRGFSFPAGESNEYLLDSDMRRAGVIVRRWQSLDGLVQIGAEPCRDGIFKLAVRVENHSACPTSALQSDSNREAILPHAFVSAHLVLAVENGEFLSLLDPSPGCEDLVSQCSSQGVWPVLAAEDATTMLASPIILYDHPKIAPESAGNLFDATEIDEILSLRILTLTEQEKQEMRQSDERAKELLERTESIPNEQFMKLHGALRGLTGMHEVRE